MTTPIARMNTAKLPASSLARLYDPATEGNSFWLDGFPSLKPPDTNWLARLVQLIETEGIVSMTTNQTLFRQLIETGALDDRFRAFRMEGKPPAEVYQILYNEEATAAAVAFSGIHKRWPWDGRVSQEASALLTAAEPLAREVRRIAKGMEGVGSFTKIPNLPVGPEVIRSVMAGEGGSGPLQVIHPNITLVFSDAHYLRTAEAYLDGLNARVQNLKKLGAGEEQIRQDISRIHSVNSLFVSRVDRAVDPMIDEAIRSAEEPTRGRLALLKGKTAVAQAKKIAQMFETIFLGQPFLDADGFYADPQGQQMIATLRRLHTVFISLQNFGAYPQRLLIASSGVKSDQPYSPLLYVLPFLGPWSANTMPEGTMEAASRFVAGLSDEQAAALKKRNLMREPLPAVPADEKAKWDEAILMNSQQRKSSGIGETTPDRILQEVKTLVLDPAKTSLRAICDTLRDKGAAAFAEDEKATLQLIQSKLQKV